MTRVWDIQYAKNWWLSLGFHIDHTDPSITIHLPIIIICIGHSKQPGFKYSLRRMLFHISKGKIPYPSSCLRKNPKLA